MKAAYAKALRQRFGAVSNTLRRFATVHPNLVRLVPAAAVTLASILSGTVDAQAHVGDNGILDTITDYVSSIHHQNGPDSLPWTGDDSVSVNLKYQRAVTFRAEDVGVEKLKEVAAVNPGDYVKIATYKHLAQNNIINPDVFIYHGVDIAKATPPDPSGPPRELGIILGSVAAFGAALFGGLKLRNWWLKL